MDSVGEIIMILTSFVAALAMMVPGDEIKCAVMGSPTKATSKAIEYAGARFPMCCGGCNSSFTKEPAKYVKAAAENGDVVGMFMFCPVSGEKLDLEKVKATTSFKGLKYGFCCDDCMAAFKKDPAKYATAPTKDSLVCAVSGEKIASYSEAAGYLDYKGTRYYVCCADCLPALKKDTEAIIAKGKATGAAPTAMPAPEKKGN